MAVTLKDIAKQANLSISTVSRIINNDQSRPASRETQDKVWRIVQELGYIPNQNARRLVRGQRQDSEVSITKTIGCIFTSTRDTYNDPFFSFIARGVQMEATERGYMLGYSFSSSNLTHSALYNNIATTPVDGAVIMGQFDKDFLGFLHNNFNNLVYAGLNRVNGGFDEVICDAYAATVCAVEHLISLGHQKVGYIGHLPDQQGEEIINEYRFDGYRDTIKKHGLEMNMEYISGVGLSTQEGYEGMKNLLSRDQIPTALFCANDSVAIGAMKAIHESGLKIPKDICLVGIDDIEMSAFVRPALTTIHVPKIELGRFAAKILIDRIEGGHNLTVKVDLPFELEVRESCGGKC